MRPLELRLSGFRSYRDERVISFREMSIVAIIGDTGAGKSSLLEAMTWALYGASSWSKRSSSELLAHGARRMSVALEFEAASERWLVTRAYGSANTAVLECLSNPAFGKVDGARQVDPEIERLLGLPYDVFCSCVLLPQGKFERLLKATPGQKTDTLKSILRLEALGAMRDRADALARRLGDRERDILTARGRFMPEPVAVAERAAERLAALEPERVRLTALTEEVVRLGESSRAHLEAARVATAERKRLADRRGDRSARLRALADVADALRTESEASRVALREADAARARAEAAHRAAAEAGLDAASLTAAVATVKAARAALRRRDQLATRIAGDERALAGSADELRAAREALTVAEQAVSAHDATRAQAQAAAAAAGDRARALADHAQRVRETTQARDVARRAHDAARAAALESARAHTVAREELEAATARRDRAVEARAAAQRENAVAHVAAGCAPGEPCPVCERALPDGFAPPHAADLARAETAVEETTLACTTAAGAERTAALTAERDAARATAAETALADTTRAAEAALEAAAPAVAEVRGGDTDVAGRGDATGGGGAAGGDAAGGDAAGGDAAATYSATLFPLDDAAGDATPPGADTAALPGVTPDDVTRAAERAAETARAAAQRVAELDAARPAVEQARGVAQRLAAQVESHATGLESGLVERRADLAHAAAELGGHVEALPPFCGATDGTDAALDGADAELERRLEAARALERQRGEAQRTAAEAAEAVRAFERQIEREVVTPLAEHRAHLLALRADLPDSALTEPAPRTGARALADFALELERELDQRVRALDAAAERHTEAEVVERLAAAQLIEEAGFGGRQALDERLMNVRAEALAATREHEAARSQIGPAGRLDDLLDRASSTRLGFEALKDALADRAFVGYVVAKRQRALLQHASRVLQDITGRYAFTDDFLILDNESGLPRSPDTLSGGETFIASLALALGLVEVADRSGGDLRALFLDEGFGTLDAAILDTALSALEERAKAGRLIGLISHVPTVAERIDTVLEIRAGVGGSTVHLLGRDEREDRVLDAFDDAVRDLG